MREELAKLDLIIPQNETLFNVYKRFYGIDNVKLVPNFRNTKIIPRTYKESGDLSIVFISRVCENKGIFDLLSAVKNLQDDGLNISLDIYGEMQLEKEEKNLFNSYLSKSIRYCGIISQSDSISIISKYDLFSLPTKYYGEGTSGSLIEAFIAGTPSLVSSYSQANLLIQDGVTGFIYEISNVGSLKAYLKKIYKDRKLLEKVGMKAQEESKKYIFEHNKECFFKAIDGK